MSETLVKVEGVSKKFCRSLKKSLWYGLQDLGREITGRRHGGNGELRPDEFWAVKDVSFELKRGECLGLIGRNGAGKTTLLRMLNGLIKPDTGRIELRGRVGALIALGAGFNPILTGRENIYVNASVLGLSKHEIDEKLTAIIDFAEIGEFIDSPVQNYSSGMQVRLGFAIAAVLDPDILVLDEVLAVGDAGFRSKCYNRIGMLQKEAAVIFVSHNMEHIARICSKVVAMIEGSCTISHTPVEGIQLYEKENLAIIGNDNPCLTVAPPFLSARVRILNPHMYWNDPLDILVQINSECMMEDLNLYGLLYASNGSVAISFVSTKRTNININQGMNVLRVHIKNIPLASGQYSLGLTLHPPENIAHILWSYKEHRITVEGGIPGFSACRLAADISVDYGFVDKK